LISNRIFLYIWSIASPNVPSNYKALIKYITLNTLPDLMIFIHTLPRHLSSNPNTRLLVLNSISFPFQMPNLSHHNKYSLLDVIKQALTKACAIRGLTVNNLISPVNTLSTVDALRR